MTDGTRDGNSRDPPAGIPRRENDRSSRNAGTAVNDMTSPESGDELADEVTEAVERAYASRLAAGTDLSPEEIKRVQEKQGRSIASPERNSRD